MFLAVHKYGAILDGKYADVLNKYSDYPTIYVHHVSLE